MSKADVAKVWWALLLVAAVIVGCGRTTSPTTEAASPSTSGAGGSSTTDTLDHVLPAPEWLSVTLRYSSRHALGRRRLDVVTTNNGTRDIFITNITLQAEHFEPLPPEVKRTRIQSGATVDIKTDFGRSVDCDHSGPRSAFVLIDMAIGSSASAQSYAISVDEEPLDIILADDCDQQRIMDAVEVHFSNTWTTSGVEVLTDLLVRRINSDQSITIAAVRGMILFGMRPLQANDRVVAVLDPGVEEIAIPVLITLARCDSHAVSQAPDGYAFRAWVDLANTEPVLVAVPPDDRLRGQLEGMVEACLSGPGGG